MLAHLVVKHFAIIDDITIQFDTGLNIITGESGAGKSILIKALSLLTGERADTTLVKSGATKATISAEFTTLTDEIIAKLQQYDLESDNECIIRRTIDIQGKSKAYINDVPTSLATLKHIAESLINICSQNSHQLLLNTTYQRTLIDTSDEITKASRQVKVYYDNLNDISQQIGTLNNEQLDTANIEFLEYQYKELSDLELRTSEAQTIEERYDSYTNAKHSLEDVVAILKHIQAAEPYLNTIEQLTEKVSATNNKLESSYELANASKVNFAELHYQIQNYLTTIGELDNNELENRISILYDIARKHHCSIAELPEVTEQLSNKLMSISTTQHTLANLNHQYDKALQQYNVASRILTRLRQKSAALLEKRVNEVLSEFAMSYMHFKVELTTNIDTVSAYGQDSIEFMICSDNTTYHLLKKIASGGELSRINLAISVTTYDAGFAPVLVFDEVDAGISGEIAKIVAGKLKNLSHMYQTLCITHQPQVAAKSDRHIRITKVASADTYTSNVKYLNKEEKLAEIATLIGGNAFSASNLATAKEMMG